MKRRIHEPCLLCVLLLAVAGAAGHPFIGGVPRVELLTFSSILTSESTTQSSPWRLSLEDWSADVWVGNPAVPLEALAVVGNLAASENYTLSVPTPPITNAKIEIADPGTLSIACGPAAGAILSPRTSALRAAISTSVNSRTRDGVLPDGVSLLAGFGTEGPIRAVSDIVCEKGSWLVTLGQAAP